MGAGTDSPPPAPIATLSPMTFSPIDPKRDILMFPRRDSGSSHSSSHNSSSTPTNTSPRPPANSGPRFTPGHHLGLGSNSPPLTPIPSNLLHPVDEEPNTPSSTIVEFGDLIRGAVPSAAELVQTVHRSISHSRGTAGSESRSRSTPRATREGSEVREGRDTRERSRNRGIGAAAALRDRSQSTHRRSSSAHTQKTSGPDKDATTEKGLAEERINRFLSSMAQQAAQRSEPELVQENRSLYQRIAALQRTERELLAENQELTRKFNTLKQHHDRRARQWSEGLRRKESEYGARIREMSEQLLNLASTTHPHKLPSNEQITSWFDRQDAAWNSWSRAFGHHDADRLSNGLHPLQLKELCSEVKGFVRLTEEGDLPPEIIDGGKEANHTLLNAMLANFICTETLASPLWVFTAASIGTLESPGIIPTNPLPGIPAVGFRMDTSTFSDVAPLRPGPACATPKSPKFPPPLITSMLPPLGTSASFLGLPIRADMERLVHMLTDAQEEDQRVAAHHWRAQMMKLFADGGFSVKDATDVGSNESRRAFVESRLNYARKLKERFLGGAARFLLHNQDSSGIELLERMLTGMIDDALRFSCSLWTRVAPLRLHAWKEFGTKEFRGASQLVTLCHTQTPVLAFNQASGSSTKNDRSVIMVVQPAIVTEAIDLKLEQDGPADESVALVWLRARVMVASPMPRGTEVPPTPAGIGSQPSSRPDTAAGKTTSSASGSTSGTPRIDTPKSFEVLPSSSYNTKGTTEPAAQQTLAT